MKITKFEARKFGEFDPSFTDPPIDGEEAVYLFPGSGPNVYRFGKVLQTQGRSENSSNMSYAIYNLPAIFDGFGYASKERINIVTEGVRVFHPELLFENKGEVEPKDYVDNIRELFDVTSERSRKAGSSERSDNVKVSLREITADLEKSKTALVKVEGRFEKYGADRFDLYLADMAQVGLETNRIGKVLDTLDGK